MTQEEFDNLVEQSKSIQLFYGGKDDEYPEIIEYLGGVEFSMCSDYYENPPEPIPDAYFWFKVRALDRGANAIIQVQRSRMPVDALNYQDCDPFKITGVAVLIE